MKSSSKSAKTSPEQSHRFRGIQSTLIRVLAILCCVGLSWLALVHYTAEVTASEADSLTKRQLHSQARQMAEISIGQNPYNGYAYYFLGYIELLLERYQEAIKHFLAGEPYMPHLTQLLKMLAQAYYFANDFEKSAQVFDRYLSMEPIPRTGADNIFRLWAQALSRTQEFGRATVALAKADSYDTYRNELLQSRLLNAILLNQVPMADYYYRAFKTAFPHKTLEPMVLFSSALAAHKMEALIRFLELNRLRGELDATSEKILAMGYAKQGRFHAAIAVLKTAARIAANDADIPLFLGDAYYQLGDMQNAIENYRRHLRLLPNSPFRKELLRRFPELENENPTATLQTGAVENVTSAPAQQPSPAF